MTKPYRLVIAQDGNFKHLFVFLGDTLAGGLLDYSPEKPLWTTAAVGKCDLSGTGMVDVARAVVVFGSYVFQCNQDILENWDAHTLVGRDDFIVGYLQDLWLILPESAITESQSFLVEGGVQ